MKTKLFIQSFQNSIVVIKRSMLVLTMALVTSMAFSQTTVVDIIVGSPEHNTLEAAVLAAELADDLSAKGSFTVFAPTDAAFAALPAGTVEKLLEDPSGDLTQILLYHVLGSKVMSGDLSNGQSVNTLSGVNSTITSKEGRFYVDNAQITVADIKADNGVVHVIDAVIIPAPPVAEATGGCN